ncbi:hypothetical protein RFI_27802 [Reticulomyxa filosa]|uniref:Uncharacterized protein n=1 Tax=Reticulomyxa filosa TaxID=46433 RepID=X6M980_RETFI|nr:hypothetical protein RFI_27802 [Reticulomyxa filosa]|eukprot:ETO09575.1 hypothetical protein RFI_27802 [Reticulomyxa filosa]
MLQYTALQNLPAPVYAVLQQLKILSAAVFSYLILREQLLPRQWRALLLLMAGGVLIESHTSEIQSGNSTSNNLFKGTVAISTIVCFSGLAGVFTQLLLKNKATPNNATPMEVFCSSYISSFKHAFFFFFFVCQSFISNVYLQKKKKLNTQLAFWSIIIGLFSLMFDYQWIRDKGHMFAGWTINTFILIFLWTSGGILVALTIKYTDRFSLIVISVVGSFLLGDVLDVIFVIGAVVTVIATFNYNEKDSVPTASAIKKTADTYALNAITKNIETNVDVNDDDVHMDPKDAEKQPLK